MQAQSDKHILGLLLDNKTTCFAETREWINDVDRDEIFTKKDCREGKPIKYLLSQEIGFKGEFNMKQFGIRQRKTSNLRTANMIGMNTYLVIVRFAFGTMEL
jgi:hypothetical protein